MEKEPTGLTIVMPTRDRPEALARALESIAASRLPSEYRGIFVVENGSSMSRTIAESFDSKLSVRYLCLEAGNKSLAINRALEDIDEGLVVVFDDDVICDPQTVASYADGAARWGEGCFFGGVNEPEWIGEPDLSLSRFFMRDMLRSRGERSGTIEPADPDFPFLGFNWAARVEDLKRAGGFDRRFGPGSRTGATGQESDMQRRLLDLGVRPVRLAQCRVRHVVSSDQTRPEWLIARRGRHGAEAGLRLNGSVAALLRLVTGQKIRLLRSLVTFVLHPTDRVTRFSIRARVSYILGVVRGWLASRDDPRPPRDSRA